MVLASSPAHCSTIHIWFSYLLVVILVCHPLSAWALVNVTVDRNSPRVQYSPMDPGIWREAWPGVRISGDGRALASLEFTGVAIYYQGWLWSQPTTFLAQVDDGTTITLELTDRAAQGPVDAAPVPTTAVTVLIVQNLTEVAHRVVLSKREGQRDVIVGSFIYATDNPPASPSSSSSPSSSAPSSKNSASSSSNRLNLQILIPTLLGSAALAFLACLSSS